MKLRKKIYLILIALITCSILFAWISPIKLVKVNHGTFFHKDYYYYMISIMEANQLYFENVNKNEISFTKVTPASVANESEYFLTFLDSVQIIVMVEKYDTTNYVPLDKYTEIEINPSDLFTTIRASSRYEPPLE
ncbi:MAG: hypothetical protein ACE364_04735 [Chlorobiota bacterium]